MTSTVPRSWAEIDLSALRHNAQVARELAGPGGRVMAVVKADAYGHGAETVAWELLRTCGIRDFGVANVSEGREIRNVVGEEGRIELLSPALRPEFATVVQLRLTPWISNASEARGYAALAEIIDRLPVVVEVDTGMGRTGVLPADLPALLAVIRSEPSLRLAGLATHLPSSDEEADFTRGQLEQFAHIAALNPALEPEFRLQSRNSAGVLGYPPGEGETVRAGLMLYGVSPLPSLQSRLRPVLTWKTRLSLVRDLPAGWSISYGRTHRLAHDSKVGTLAAGYADGYHRSLAHHGTEVLVRGQRCPLLGRVTMDQMMVDVSQVPGVQAGDEVVLLGRQGSEEIPASEVAAKAGTIPWEIFTGLSRRVGRTYV